MLTKKFKDVNPMQLPDDAKSAILDIAREILRMESHRSKAESSTVKRFESAVSSVFIAWLASCNKKLSVKARAFIEHQITDDSLKLYLLDKTEGQDEKINALLQGHGAEHLAYFVLFADHEIDGSKECTETTPFSICTLATRLLSIEEGDEIADFGTGIGNFLVAAGNKAASTSYYAFDISRNLNIAKMRAYVLDLDSTIEQKSVFDLESAEKSFDKIFFDMPLGVRFSMRDREDKGTRSLITKYPAITRGQNADWAFCMTAIESLRQGGKAVVTLPSGAIWNTSSKTIRRLLIESGMVEGVISLPPRLYRSTNIAINLIVFSFENKNVKFLDASKIFRRGRRINEMTQEHIEQIFAAYCKESDISTSVDKQTIEEKDYSLDPRLYFEDELKVENGIPLKDLVSVFTRGAACRADELDALISAKTTAYQYLMLKNINDCRIDDDLPYLNDLEPRLEKYCLEDGDIVLSKNGKPFKMAIASVGEGKKILANGNLFILRIDKEKVEPAYVLAYLMSGQGEAALKRIVVGSTIPSIPLSSLKKLLIPMVSRKEQQSIVNQFLAASDEVELLKRQMAKAYDRQKNLF